MIFKEFPSVGVEGKRRVGCIVKPKSKLYQIIPPGVTT